MAVNGGDSGRRRQSTVLGGRRIMAAQRTQEQIMAQMNMELNAARARIDALTNQHRQAVEEIESLRNQNPMPTLPPPPPPFFPSTTVIPLMPSVTTIPPFFHSTTPIPSRPPTTSIPTMLMPSFQFNEYASDLSQRNVFQNSGYIPSDAQGSVLDDPVAQRFKMLEEQNERVLSLLAKLPGAAVPVDVEPRIGSLAVARWRSKLATYITSFKRQENPLAVTSVRNCDTKTAIKAYKHSLDESSGLYTDRTKCPPENFEDVHAITLAYMRVEDDATFRCKHSSDKKSLSVKKPEFKARLTVKAEPSRQISNVWFDKKKVLTTTNFPQYPKISSYGFKGTYKDLGPTTMIGDYDSVIVALSMSLNWNSGLVHSSDFALGIVAWQCRQVYGDFDLEGSSFFKGAQSGVKSRFSLNLANDKDDDKKDKTKWCDFHDDHGYTTDDCKELKKELAWHVPKGNLKGILDGQAIPDRNIRPPSPDHEKVVCCVAGGSDVCGDLHQKHHDGLIVQLKIGNCLTRRVLVDGGSSANIIFLDTIIAMGLDKSKIVRRSTMFVGFNGDAMSTYGEIVLPVYAKGINKQTRFNVIDCSSEYNVILGRRWIHKMKAIPSTYHQTIKFPTPWGIQEIKSEPKIARDCYKITMKPRKQSI
ncbi:hypothetical protein L6452_05234 [Arctium lappa]|uniref:Uncharacterized protein n=1 Tax=Arctium lappa TaxID=4217 RepID=A0ACB9EGX0_ARCLA|nr:hypothetical protein L6452_05234 [Arctium lappa]